MVGVFGAYHGSEVGFVFNVKRELHGSELDLSARMASYWTNFAAVANPNGVNEVHALNANKKFVSSRDADGGEHTSRHDVDGANVCLNGGSGGPCPVVLDVRTSREWHAGHVECAHFAPFEDNHTLIEQVRSLVASDLSRLVVTYCHTGVHAEQAEIVLRDAGFTNVLNGGGLLLSNTEMLDSLCRCASPCAANVIPNTMAAFVSPTPSFNPTFRTPRLGDLHHRFVNLPTTCELLVRVIGSSVNPADRGAPGSTVVMGSDIAGRVVVRTALLPVRRLHLPTAVLS